METASYNSNISMQNNIRTSLPMMKVNVPLVVTINKI